MLAPAYVPTHEYAVSSAMRRLTSGFGMGPGVPASPWRPTNSVSGWGMLSPFADEICSSIEGKEEANSRARFRPISTAQLSMSPRLHLRPIDLVVYQESFALRQRCLILRQASRLDAFSGYPFRTRLPCYAVGTTTGPPEVRPSRSSRTRDRPSQTSCAHSR